MVYKTQIERQNLPENNPKMRKIFNIESIFEKFLNFDSQILGAE